MPMREYVRSCAASRDRAFAFPWLRRMISNWHARKHLRRLEDFDDHMLADIGLTRDDLRLGRSLPWDVDPMAEIIRRRNRIR